MVGIPIQTPSLQLPNMSRVLSIFLSLNIIES